MSMTRYIKSPIIPPLGSYVVVRDYDGREVKRRVIEIESSYINDKATFKIFLGS